MPTASSTKKAKAPTRTKDGKVRFPKKELNSWLRRNKSWNHQQWDELIQELTQLGFEDWTSNQEGRDQLGLYLEEKKKS